MHRSPPQFRHCPHTTRSNCSGRDPRDTHSNHTRINDRPLRKAEACYRRPAAAGRGYIFCRAALCVCLCLCVYSRVGASCVGRPICVCAVLAPLRRVNKYIFECRVRSNPKLHHSVLGTATHRALPRGTWSSRETWSSLYSRHVPDAEPDHGYRITSAEVCFRAQSFGHVFHEIKGVSVNHL